VNLALLIEFRVDSTVAVVLGIEAPPIVALTFLIYYAACYSSVLGLCFRVRKLLTSLSRPLTMR
jgi:hypothetical protein